VAAKVLKTTQQPSVQNESKDTTTVDKIVEQPSETANNCESQAASLNETREDLASIKEAQISEAMRNADTMEAPEPTHSGENENDLRWLACTLCDFRSERTPVIELVKHLKSVHHRKTSEIDEERLIVYGCSECSNFRPQSVQTWAAHFGRDFTECRGGAILLTKNGIQLAADYGQDFVECRLSAILLAKNGIQLCESENWCDTCCETYTNIKGHFASAIHSRNIDQAVCTTYSKCEECEISFTSPANRKLHSYLAHQ